MLALSFLVVTTTADFKGERKRKDSAVNVE
jgi:hypothetical protein